MWVICINLFWIHMFLFAYDFNFEWISWYSRPVVENWKKAFPYSQNSGTKNAIYCQFTCAGNPFRSMGWTFLSNYGVMNYQWSLLKLKNTRLCVHSGIKGNKHNVADLWSDWKTLTCLTKGNKLLVMLKEKKNSAGGESLPPQYFN